MPLSERAYEEKRDFIRMNIHSQAKVTTDSGEDYHGVCLNLSGGGALLELPTQAPGTGRISLTIQSQHGHAPMFSASGKVVRVAQGKTPQSRLVAIAYDT